MKYIQISRIETFLKSKGFEVDTTHATPEKEQENNYWRKVDGEKVVVPKKDVLQSNELPGIFNDSDLLMEFRKF